MSCWATPVSSSARRGQRLCATRHSPCPSACSRLPLHVTLFSVNELRMLCCDTNTSTLRLEGSVLSPLISYSFRACNDDKHFHSVLIPPGELSGIWVRGCIWVMTETRTIYYLNCFSKPFQTAPTNPRGSDDRFVAVGKVGDDRWSTLWDGVHKVRRWYISTGQPSPLLQNHRSEMTFLAGSGSPGWQGDLRASDKLRYRNMSAEPGAPSSACQPSSKSSKVDRSL